MRGVRAGVLSRAADVSGGLELSARSPVWTSAAAPDPAWLAICQLPVGMQREMLGSHSDGFGRTAGDTRTRQWTEKT